MTRKEFIITMRNKGYVVKHSYAEDDKHVEFWGKHGHNTLIEVKEKSFNRIVKFDSGRLGHVENLSFDKTHVLDWTN